MNLGSIQELFKIPGAWRGRGSRGGEVAGGVDTPHEKVLYYKDSVSLYVWNATVCRPPPRRLPTTSPKNLHSGFAFKRSRISDCTDPRGDFQDGVPIFHVTKFGF